MRAAWAKRFSAASFLVLGLLVATPAAANADGGHVIDDTIFNNTTSMNINQIDTFLNGQSSSCISQNNGFSTPDPLGFSSSQGKYTFGPNVSGGQAISDISTHYSVNPQVVLAEMQKEQSIPTGAKGCHYDKPNPADSSQLYTCTIGNKTGNCTDACPTAYGGGCMNIAMSYDCPGSCWAAAEGFGTQISGAAWLLRFAEERAYGILTGYPGYDSGDEYYTYSGPLTAGQRQRVAGGPVIDSDGTWTDYNGTTVTIANGSTASLYTYTPFVSDTKFQDIFNNWFGSTLTSGYEWQPISQTAYTDSSMSTSLDTLNLLPGQRFYLVINAKNIGSVTWQKGVYGRQVNVGTDYPHDRKSTFCDSTWAPNCNRPGTTAESTVTPGQTGTFGFWMAAPGWAGTYYEHFNLVMDGTSWMNNDPGLYWTLRVKSPSWQPTSQSAYTDSAMSTPVNTLNLAPNQRYYMVIQARNTGSTKWQKGVAGQQVNLGTSGPQDRYSNFCDNSWLNTSACNRIATTTSSPVAPGQIGTFAFWITTPNQLGTYYEHFNLVMDGTSWLNDPGLYWTYRINNPNPTWQPLQQSAYTDSAMSTPVNTLNLAPNQRYYLLIKAKNTGNVTWQNGVWPRQVNLGTSNPRDRYSAFCDSSWLNTSDCNRIVKPSEPSVATGQTATYGFWITTPSKSGTYNEYFNLVMDGTSWLNDPGLYWTLKVN